MTTFIRIFLFLLSLGIYNEAKSQQLAKSDLLKDLYFLNEAIQNGHPANYRQASKVSLDTLILQIEQDFGDSISWRLYESKVREAVWEIGCVHTSVKTSPIRQKEKVSNGFFPLDVFVDSRNKLFLLEELADTSSTLEKGDEITAINGLPVPLLLNDLFKYKSPDGRSLSYVKQIINRNFAALYFIYFGASQTFEIEFTHDCEVITERISGRSKLFPAKEPKLKLPENATVLFEGNKASFSILPGNTGLLRIESFQQKYRSFYRKIFRYLKENPIDNLIIDLRENLGGSRAHVEVLLSYLIPEKTSYSIIRPKKNLGKYLKGKQKMTFLASYLYFELQAMLISKKRLTDGTAYIYKIKPKRYIYEKPIYLLVNGYSASSSTVTAAYLKHHRNAIVIGERTSGGEYWNNGGSYPNLVLPQSGIEIRTATYRFEYDFKGENQGGIFADYPVEYDINTYMKGNLEMDKALELIQMAH